MTITVVLAFLFLAVALLLFCLFDELMNDITGSYASYWVEDYWGLISKKKYRLIRVSIKILSVPILLALAILAICVTFALLVLVSLAITAGAIIGAMILAFRALWSFIPRSTQLAT
ncbi:MAG TPA: hypothetical protein VE973_01290 [Candidatus Limnocylindria bacterium]|nr:hypothetical protein [Candidatus Limnocylindria bacterium]